MKPIPPFLGVYVHVPFCRRKCAYCGFYSAACREDAAERFVDALGAEIAPHAAADARAMYVGGGTPTILPEPLFEDLLLRLKRAFPGVQEFTVEANPDSLTLEKACIMKNAGVTRVSIGIQSLSPGVLAAIGRAGRVADPRAVADLLASAGFSREALSFDVIYGIGGQMERDIRATLDAILETGVPHVSLYCFTLEADSRLALTRSAPVASDDVCREHYFLIEEVLRGAGIERYEVSNFARRGFECAHNLNYWKGGEWHGFGPAASGTRHENGHTVRATNAPDLHAYIEALQMGGKPPSTVERLTMEEEMEEGVLLGLRLAEGIDIPALARRFGERAAAELMTRAQPLLEQGVLMEKDRHISVARGSVLLTDEIAAELLAGLPT